MFRVIGIVAVIAVLVLGIAHFTGHLKLTGNAQVTNKGSALLEKSVQKTQELTNKGFDALKK